MAIAFDAATDGGQTSGTPATKTFAHTNTNASLLFVAGIANQADVTGVSDWSATYAGNAMTLLGSILGTGTTDKIFVFYQTNPTTGTNNVVLTQGATKAQFASGIAHSFTGTDTSTPVDDHGGTADGSGGSLTITKTTTATDDWGILFASGQSNLTASTQITARVDTTTHYFSGDTNGGLGAPASESIAVTIVSNNGCAYGVFFKAAAAINSNFFALM